ncbi:uncharacterized protein LOC141718785 [Apium graveolens]|uniref:uncharacterized protein LOC141718785 n=1 Tax=Apium graveolens TaxID=4045 RepID=UPI003D79D216
MLFYGDDKDNSCCRYCGISRYKDAKEGGSNTILRNVLRYFPLTTRLKRLYMFARTAEHMKWYKNRVVTEGVHTHPADGEEWKEFDKNYPDFSQDIRNVRLGLTTYGFPPYSNGTSGIYSVWPVLIQLWQCGVETYDASTKTNFILRAALLWTISDYPGLAMVSGFHSVQEVCVNRFSGTWKLHSKERDDGYGVTHNWTQVTSFFDLPYGDTLRLRYCIDVMHIEKNVFENVFHTVIGSFKLKDTTTARKDLEALNIIPELWLNGSRKHKAKYTFNRDQLKLLCNWVVQLKFSDGCSSNIARYCKVSQLKFHEMKSHDCHVFMQKFLPSTLRELLPNDIHKALCDLSNFFKGLCAKELLLSDLVKMQKNVVGIVCTLETIFFPGFFDPMEHLLVHLVE